MHVAVIGHGPIGAAAARHLAAAGHRVSLIGPPEPVSKARHQGPFASHYDEGRIVRVLDHSSLWTTIKSASIARFATIEAAVGHPLLLPGGRDDGRCRRRTADAGRRPGASGAVGGRRTAGRRRAETSFPLLPLSRRLGRPVRAAGRLAEPAPADCRADRLRAGDGRRTDPRDRHRSGRDRGWRSAGHAAPQPDGGSRRDHRRRLRPRTHRRAAAGRGLCPHPAVRRNRPGRGAADWPACRRW